MSQSPIESSPPVLDYIPSITRPRFLTLESRNGSVRVTFPVPPMWACILPIVWTGVVGLMKATMGIWFVLLMRSLSHEFRTSEPFFFRRRFEIEILLSTGLSALFWWSAGGFQLWQLYRWGTVPRVFEANRDGLVLSWLGWWRMRERRWPAAEVAAVEFRSVKGNLNWTRTVADLTLVFRNGRRRRFRLSSPDSELPGQVAKELASAIGCRFG